MVRRPALNAPCSFFRKPASNLKRLFGPPCSFSSSATNQGEHKRRYLTPSSLVVEDVEGYKTGGFHPLCIGDVLCDDRYQILHKLGFDDSSTVWIARDRCPEASPSPQGRLVALKVLTANLWDRGLGSTPEVVIPSILGAIPRDDSPLLVRNNIQRLEDFFKEYSPNGTHICLVSALAGPSVFTVSKFLSYSNSKLRSDLARRLAQQITSVIECMHYSSRVVCGDISTETIRFSPVDDVHTWSDAELYAKLGHPHTADLVTLDGSALGPSAPTHLVGAIYPSHFITQSLLQENVMLADFRRSFAARPWVYHPPTASHLEPPEGYFDRTIDFASDIWMLACALFEIRAGYPLFKVSAFSESLFWKGMVEMLGKLPDPWWRRFEGRRYWFDENGDPRPKYAQKMDGLDSFAASRSSIRQTLREIGDTDKDERLQSDVESSLSSEPVTSRMAKKEVELFADLLEKMLRYEPSERIAIGEVARHPWFHYDL